MLFLELLGFIYCKMRNAKFRNYLHLHGIIIILGFTAVLGKLIVTDAFPLVWYRMLIAAITIFIFIKLRSISLKISKRTAIWVILGGIIIALHWLTFFEAIKISNVSVTLAMMSTGAFFTAILEPLWYKRKFIGYELLLGLLVMVGLYLIFRVETQYSSGILLALLSAALAAVFSLINGRLVQHQKAALISFYELMVGVVFLSLLGLTKGVFTKDFFMISSQDWIFIVLLATVCTAYAFLAAIDVMRYLSPYTVMLSINLEPVYGICLAYFILGDSEHMNPTFYWGGLLILGTVLLNAILKNTIKLKKG